MPYKGFLPIRKIKSIKKEVVKVLDDLFFSSRNGCEGVIVAYFA